MSPPRRTPATTEQLRASLVEHAAAVVARDGAAALTMRSLAAEAGCAVGLPYKVFTDRGELVVELVLREFARLQLLANRLVERAGSGTVAGNLIWYAEALLDSPAVALAGEVLGDPDLAKSLHARVDELGTGPSVFEAAFADYLVAERHAGRLDRGIDVEAIAFFLAGGVHNLVVAGAAWPRPTRRRLRRFITGLAARL